MQFTSVFAAALVSLSSLVSAQGANVVNNCDFTVFLQSFPFDGSAPGPFTVLKPGKSYSETYRDGGSTIKLSNKRTLANPLFNAYTNEDTQIFYSLDDQFGNPFIKFHNKLVPSSPQCKRFNCGANNSGCYSDGGSKVFQCAKPVSITTTLCV